MAIPDFQTLMLPLLRRLAVSRIKTGALIDVMADEFGLTDAERSTMLPSGRQTAFSNRVHWALAYLTRAKLSDRPARATYEASERGRAVLADPPLRIDTLFLRQFPEFRTLRPDDRLPEAGDGVVAPASTAAISAIVADTATLATPDEQIAAAVALQEQQVREELLRQVLAAPPVHFERTVVKLMLKLGYGSPAENAGEALGRGGDGGVDGVIREDRLGLDLIYLQAKRYAETAIVVDQLRAFAGALGDKGARKGVFITTTRFTREAELFAARQQDKRIVLIDGERLTLLMLRHDVGVRTEKEIVLKRVDLDFFDPEDA